MGRFFPIRKGFEGFGLGSSLTRFLGVRVNNRELSANKIKMSREYTGAIVLVLGSLLKLSGHELPSVELETIVVGLVALGIAVARYFKGDITVFGAKK